MPSWMLNIPTTEGIKKYNLKTIIFRKDEYFVMMLYINNQNVKNSWYFYDPTKNSGSIQFYNQDTPTVPAGYELYKIEQIPPFN